jgi:metallo-beta-lactamase family protein
MKITCLGAAGCVTGSCFLLDNGERYLVDCGLFQGGRQMEALNRKPWGFRPGELTALFLTHAHIDHCGRIPKLVKDGFKGRIYATTATVELCKILLLDSAHIQEMEAEWQTRKNRRGGNPDVEPLYTVQDAEACFDLFEAIEQDKTMEVNPRLKVRFRNAGHILGSSILEFSSDSPSRPFKTVFSGDLGYEGKLILQDPEQVPAADILLIESTYGNRQHKSVAESEEELIEAILYSHRHGEKVIIPSFAIERTQELLYMIGEFFRKKLIPSMPVYLDSPLAIAATEIFKKMKDYYDEEALEILNNGHDPFTFPELILSHTSQESMAINQAAGPAIILAGNGMCTAGRIKHHLKHNLWRSGSSVVIVGFQAVGTLGRRLVEGARSVKVLGEEIAVKAKVFTIGGFSAHADQAHLLEWLSHLEKNPHMRIYAVHGEQTASEVLATEVRKRFGYSIYVPAIGDVILPEEAKPSEIVEERREIDLHERLRRIVEKAERIRDLWEASGLGLPTDLSEQLGAALLETENGLDEILERAQSAAKAESKRT